MNSVNFPSTDVAFKVTKHIRLVFFYGESPNKINYPVHKYSLASIAHEEG